MVDLTFRMFYKNIGLMTRKLDPSTAQQSIAQAFTLAPGNIKTYVVVTIMKKTRELPTGHSFYLQLIGANKDSVLE